MIALLLAGQPMSMAHVKTPLEYPYSLPPAPGKTIEVAPGVRWLRMPLPMSLDHINLYLLEDDDGWYVNSVANQSSASSAPICTLITPARRAFCMNIARLH
jgi:hypothetical protein